MESLIDLFLWTTVW